jgi:hypothetical protein
MKDVKHQRSSEDPALIKDDTLGIAGHTPSQPPIIMKLRSGRSQYATEWGNGNARQFAIDGHYEWMTSFLNAHARILEIGTGNGSGTTALLSSGHIVVGIDENPECLKIAKQNIETAGFDVTYEQREVIQSEQTGYKIAYATPKSSMPKSGTLLLEGDILNDPALLEWIKKNGPFDAIACWLIGAYYERTFNVAITGLGIASPGEYRFEIHNHICRIADQVLVNGGVLHIVDRSELPESQSVSGQHRDYYHGLITGTSLKVVSIDYANYQEPSPSAAPAIKLASVVPGNDPNLTPKIFVSTVYRKQ